MLFNKFKSTIAKYHLLQEGDKILVACSGGADSIGLLSLFLELKKELVLAPGVTRNLVFFPMKPGTYKFFDDFHPETGQGRIVAK